MKIQAIHSFLVHPDKNKEEQTTIGGTRVPVPVFVNGKLISQTSFEQTIGGRAAGFASQARRQIASGGFAGTLETFLNSQARLLARLTNITLGGQPVGGELSLVQDGGHTLGFRNLFGLAPIPISSVYSLGGFVNLAVLHPTAGREALSRESIQQVAGLVSMIEAESSRDIASTAAADQNQAFQQYILNNNLTALAGNVTIQVLPSRRDVALGTLARFEPQKGKVFYAGRDSTVLQTFATEQTNLLHLSHPKLNNFQMFLALSDRAWRTEGEFFRYPHTTRLIWAAHRVIYIFTDATGGLSLYYDIELREPLTSEATGGAMFPTTTIVTKDRIYIPVPKSLEPAFQITAGAKEFYVRFDTIP